MPLTRVLAVNAKLREGFQQSLRLRRRRCIHLRRFPETARKKEAAIFGGSILSFTQEAEILLQLGRNARELAVERRADRIDRRDDHDRDTGGDQAVFDRSRTRLVLENANSLDI